MVWWIGSVVRTGSPPASRPVSSTSLAGAKPKGAAEATAGTAREAVTAEITSQNFGRVLISGNDAPIACAVRCPFVIIVRPMKLLRMKPGHGEILLAEGDPEVAAQERELIEAFRAQLDQGLWAAVPTATTAGRREATLVRSFDEVPRDAERVIFFPPAAGGR